MVQYCQVIGSPVGLLLVSDHRLLSTHGLQAMIPVGISGVLSVVCLSSVVCVVCVVCLSLSVQS